MDLKSTENTKEEASFKQQNYISDIGRSPASSPLSSSNPIPFTSTPTSSTDMEDVFMASSPPRASSSPIAIRKQMPKQDEGVGVKPSLNCKEHNTSSANNLQSTRSETYSKDTIVITSPKVASSSIKGSVTICSLQNTEKYEGKCKQVCENVEEDVAKGSKNNSNIKSKDFASFSWNSADSHNMNDDTKATENQQHKCKKGDTPTEVFKVAALYVT